MKAPHALWFAPSNEPDLKRLARSSVSHTPLLVRMRPMTGTHCRRIVAMAAVALFGQVIDVPQPANG